MKQFKGFRHGLTLPSSLNQSNAILFSVLVYFFKLSHCVGNHTIFCSQIEQHSLLNFKQSLTDQRNLLSSWDIDVNCCKWQGVVCNDLTGHVQGLHLQGDPDAFEGLSGEINPSLLNLTRLRYLDLSLNKFEQTIPSFFGSFTNLKYLNLSMAGFYGKIPHTLGNLSNLHVLDLAASPSSMELAYVVKFWNNISVDKIDWLWGLSKLEYLNMNGANLSRATNWPLVINTLSSLLHLHFRECNLQFVASLNEVNTTSLRFLDLSRNNNQPSSPSPIPTWIFQLSNLVFLDISSNYLEGAIPRISNTTKLRHIDLQDNKFYSSIPEWLFLCTDLEVLYLSENHFSGELSDEFGELKSLRILSLNENSFSGALPMAIGKLESLEGLYLDQNKFSGNIPESIGQLSNLRDFAIAGNRLEGIVSEGHFANLTKLIVFGASRNRLSLNVGDNWIPPFRLGVLELSGWNLSTSFDQSLSWIQTQKGLLILDLSNTGISGQIPHWILDIEINYLNISHNNIHGKVPYLNGSVYAFLSSNQLSGSLPQITEFMTALDLSDNSFSGGMSHFLCNGTSNLEILHLQGNQLGGELPNFWMQLPWLRYLNLGNNMISGSIPTTFGYLVDLESLNLYGNSFSGQIPFSMQNCTSLWKIDLEDNDLDGNIPKWLGKSLSKLRFLILGSNKLSGEISPMICHLNSLQILDLSHNKLSGVIPSCVNNFTAMSKDRSLDSLWINAGWRGFVDSASIFTKGGELEYDTILSLVTSIDLSKNYLCGEIPKELISLVELRTLNLSQNHFTGSLPSRIGDMKQLESLDVSRNYLSGRIPSSIALISSLSYLNLSYNNLTGEIPIGTQIQGFDASSFIGTNLCGPPLPSSCNRDGDGDEVPHPGHEDGDTSTEIKWFYVFLSSGFTLGVSIVCSVMAFKKSWREAYYGWLEYMWDKLYVFVCVHWRRLRFLKGNQNLN